jgi:energy-coupling factor transporter transmembrane protein EcfT
VTRHPPNLGSSLLGRRNPTVKLALLFLVSLAMMFVLDPVTPGVLYLLALGGVAGAAGVTVRTLLRAHIPFVAFACGIFVVNALSRGGDVVFEIMGMEVTADGLALGTSLALRTMVVGILSIGFVLSTEPVALITSLNQHARMGPRITYALLAGYRMLQEMPAEWQTICHAHAVRAPAQQSLLIRARTFMGAAFSLLVVSLRKGERMAESLEGRGLGLHPRTVWRPVALSPADWVFAGGVLVALSGVVVLSGALGFLRSPGALFGE